MRVQRVTCLVVALSFLSLLPAAWAQTSDSATIAGVVRDTSGAVLPGVTVEAASPALIEKVKTVVTDGEGLYRIVDLRPGAYVVTFSLPGFSTLRREGLELTTGFTATINAEMRVGALEESITVSGQAPVVDLQSARQTTNVQRATLDALPTSGRIPALASIIPGATVTNQGMQSVGNLNERPQYGIHGGRSGDNAPTVDGINQRLLGGAIYVFNNLTFQEVVVETSGMTAERTTGGVQISMVPKDGGNMFTGTFKTSNTGPSLQKDNLTQELIDRNLKTLPGGVKKHYDTGGTLGGPIARDKLWFFFGTRFAANQEYQQGNYFNLVHGIPISSTSTPQWPGSVSPSKIVTLYQQDLSRPAYGNDFYHDYSLRLTWQAAQKHKIVVSYGVQPNCSCYYPLLESAGGTLPSPEATGQHTYNVNYLPLVSWSFPATNRLLFEAGASANVFNNHTKRQPEATTNIIGIEEQNANYRYGSRSTGVTHTGGYRVQHNRQYRQRFATSYITGSHSFKTGVDLAEYQEGDPLTHPDPDQNHGGLAYRFRGTTPNRITLWAIPFESMGEAKDMSVYGQDQWTAGRMTLNLGLRFSKYTGYIPATTLPAGPWVPERSFPEVKNSPNFTNLNPRVGMSYDLFGNGKTALKGSFGRFNPYNIAAVDIPASNQATNTTITWTDSNTNYYPDCNLQNTKGENNTATGGDVCGPWSELSFGQVRQGNTKRADDAREGFNANEVQWQGSISVQHELWTNVALNVGYFRTWYSNFLATDNTLTTVSDYDSFCVMAPVDSRLGDVSGTEVCGLYDVSKAKNGQTLNSVTQSSNYDANRKQVEVFNGVDVTVNARFLQGGQLSGGLSLGRTSTDNCYTLGNPQLQNTGGTLLLPREESVLQHRPLVGVVHAGEVPVRLPAAVSGAGERDLSEHPWASHPREQAIHQRRGQSIRFEPQRAQPRSVGVRDALLVGDQCRDRPYSSKHDVRGSAAAAGSAVLEDLPVRPEPAARQLRHVQPLQRQQRPQRDDPVHDAWWRVVAEPDFDHGWAPHQVHRAVRLLSSLRYPGMGSAIRADPILRSRLP